MDATASTAAARDGGYDSLFIVGIVKAPVEATFAEAEPEMEPKNPDARTETFAAPPRKRPAIFVEILINALPPSPTPTNAPRITKIATTFTETPVSAP